MQRPVLVIDGNPITRKLVRTTLEGAGHRVIDTDDAATALQLAREHAPNLILQDIVLAGYDGLDLVGRFRAEPALAHTRILALTGFFSAVDDPRARAFDDILLKPVEPSRLVAIIERHLPREPVAGVGRGLRILAVDDDPGQLRLTRAILMQAGFTVERASDGAEALELARRQRPHAILSDVAMPVMDGFSLARAVRSDPALASIPVLLITAFPEREDHDAAFAAGADALFARTPGLEKVIPWLAEAAAKPSTVAVAAVADQTLEDATARLFDRQLKRQRDIAYSLAERAETQATILRNVARLSDTLARRTDLDEALGEVVYRLVDLSGASKGMVILLGDGEPRVAAAVGVATSELAAVPALLAGSDAYRRLLDVQEVIGYTRETAPGDPIIGLLDSVSIFLIPLMTQGSIIGALVLGSNLGTDHERDWIAFAQTIGVQVGLAIGLNQALAESRRSGERLHTLMTHATDAIATFDGTGRLVDANVQFERLTGLTAAALRGCDIGSCLGAVGGDDVFDPWTELAATGVSIRSEISLTRADGGERVVDWAARAVELDGTRSIIAIVHDLTERVHLARQLRQAQKMEAIGQLTGGIAHDFNNLLTAILGYAEFLTPAFAAEDPRRHDLEEIQKAGESAARLTRQLLAFSRKQALRPIVFDLAEVVEKMDRLLQRVIGEDISLVAHADPGVFIDADPGQLEQVVMNLAVNARDAMPQGGQLTIEASTVELDQPVHAAAGPVPPGTYVRLSIADTGTGMTPHVLEHLFEPFFTTKEVGRGTGLGLATVYGIVQQTGAHVAVESAVGKGTRFSIYFTPAAAAARVAEPKAPVVAPGHGTILVVEDEPGVRRFTASALVRSGYRVLEAASPSEAREIFELHRDAIDLVLTDLVMPGGTGAELASELKASSPNLGVLFMTGYARTVLDGQKVVDGPIIEKPFSAAELSARVRQAMSA